MTLLSHYTRNSGIWITESELFTNKAFGLEFWSHFPYVIRTQLSNAPSYTFYASTKSKDRCATVSNEFQRQRPIARHIVYKTLVKVKCNMLGSSKTILQFSQGEPKHVWVRKRQRRNFENIFLRNVSMKWKTNVFHFIETFKWKTNVFHFISFLFYKPASKKIDFEIFWRHVDF